MYNRAKSLAVLLRLLTLALLLCASAKTLAQTWNFNATAVSESQINLGWTPIGYYHELYRWNGSSYVLIYASSENSFADTGLSGGTLYQYKVIAYTEVWGQKTKFASATTFPYAPTNLGVTSVPGLQVNLSWTDNSGNETGFKIERKTGAGGTYAQIGTTGANVTSYSDTAPATETTYYYRVRANINTTNSFYSNEASAVALGVPTGLNATAAAGARADLAWTDASSGETGFKIERKTGAGGTYAQVATVGANVTTWFESGLAPATYYYRVRATNALGDSSYSAEASVGFILPNAPSSLSAADQPGGQIRLGWTDNSDNETGFKVERKTGAGGTYAQMGTAPASATTYDDSSGLSAGATYYYRIRSTNFAGDSAYSNEVSIVASLPNVTGGTVTYEYDPFGNVIKTTAGGVLTTLAYDLRGRKISTSDPDMGVWTYDYNALGELVRQRDAKLQVTTMAYDLLGRMVSRSGADLNGTWTFDSCTKGVGKLCQASADNGYQRAHTYDSLGRPSSTTTTIDAVYTVTTTYDGAGRLDKTIYPTGFEIQNVYNARGYLEKVRNATTPTTVYWTANALNASGKVLSETLDAAINTTRTFDAVGRLLTVSTTGSSGTVQNNSYTYDFLGNVTQRTDLQVTENFSYDSLNRLTLSSGPGLTTKVYDYDALGNIIYKSDVGVYTYGTRPHAVASTSGVLNATFSYDDNGNLTSGNGRTVTYTSFNMAATITASGYTYTYTYNTEHQRMRLIHSTLGTFIYLHPNGGGELLYEKEIKPGGLVEHKHYMNGGSGFIGVYLSRSDATTEMRYFLKDHLGSIQVVTTSTGTVCETLAYEAFGKRRFTNGADDPNNTLSGSCGDRGFSGHEHLDEIALIHMNARVYDPQLARFMTPDPFIKDLRSLQDFNRYSYAANNPLRFIDPTGYLSSQYAWEDGPGGSGLGDLGDMFDDPFGDPFGGPSGGSSVDVPNVAFSALDPTDPYKEARFRCFGCTVHILFDAGGGPTSSELRFLATRERWDVIAQFYPNPADAVAALRSSGAFNREVARNPSQNAQVAGWALPAVVVGGTALLIGAAGQSQHQNAVVGQLIKAYADLGYQVGYIFKSDSLVLGRNLTEADFERDASQVAHHLVASGHPLADPARRVLDRFGIDINSWVNGMFLDADYHQGIHTNLYYTNVNLMLAGATSQGDVLLRLGFIRAMIDTRSFPYLPGK